MFPNQAYDFAAFGTDHKFIIQIFFLYFREFRYIVGVLYNKKCRAKHFPKLKKSLNYIFLRIFRPCEIIILTRKLSQFLKRKFSFFEKAWVYIVCDICVWVLIYKIIANIWSRNFATRGYSKVSFF